jgi:hypothetical protein
MTAGSEEWGGVSRQRPDDPGEWSRWTEVRDRDELRRRLEVLAASEDVDESQVEFVQFFFRASDPVLYPLAAVAVGRWLLQLPALEGWLREYADRRGIPLAGAIPLAGVRSHRRVLVAAAAAWARDADRWVELSGERAEPTSRSPLGPLTATVPLDRAADLAAHLRACRLMVAEGTVTPELAEHVRRALARVVETPERMLDVAVAARWGELAAAEPVVGRTEVEDLRQAAVAWLDGWVRRPGTEDSAGGLGERLRALRAREILSSGAEAGGSEGEAAAVPSRDRADIVRDLVRASEGRRWWALDEAERARVAFRLITALSEGGLPAGEWGGLMDALEVTPGSGPLPRLVLQIARVEGTDPATLVDATLLHSVEDESLLVALVPSGPPGEVGAAVADALEHRIRMGLNTDVEFRVERLLARIELRNPHPGFFHLLSNVVADREYVGMDGVRVPLADWLARLHGEARALREQSRVVLEPSPPVPGPLGEIRQHVRGELQDLTTVRDPAAVVRGVLGLLTGPAGEEEGRRDLRTLVEQLHDQVPVEVEARLARAARILASEGGSLVPGTLDGVAETHAAVEGLGRELVALRTTLAPLLPAAEARALQDTLAEAGEALDGWLESLVRVEARRCRGTAGAGGGDEEEWDTLLMGAREVEPSEHRQRILPVVWETLVVGESGESLEALLRWAVGAASRLSPGQDREVWLRGVAGQWDRMVLEGIDEGLETRVARLVRDPGAEALAGLPGVDAALEKARTWLFDCYRVGDAIRVTRALNLRRGRGGAAAVPRDLLGFFLHYSPVWLALLVGAILMLDFGDAWTAMAEVEDVRGIAITFVLGVGGAFGYAMAELHARVRDGPGDRVWENRMLRLLRVLGFVAVCLAYTLAVVGLMWWLLSGTDEVVRGAGAVLHVVVWSGFALFVGVFFGLMAKAA